MSRWLITNARLVNEGTIRETDLRIARGRIERIDENLSGRPRETVFDANGAYLMPGMIDSRAHFREPGYIASGNIASESRAAVAGGITSYLDWPDTQPRTVTRRALADKFSRAEGRSVANFSFCLGIDPEHPEMLRETAAGDAAAVVVTVGAGDDAGSATLEHVAECLADRRLPIMISGELSGASRQPPSAARPAQAAGGWLEAHPVGAATALIEASITLSRRHALPLILPSLSAEAELRRVEAAVDDGLRLLAGTGLAQLYFMQDDYDLLGERLFALPPVRSDHDRRALRRGLARGALALINSAHAPVLLRDKRHSAARADHPGMPTAQYALPVAWSLVAARMLSPTELVERLAHAPARAFGVTGRGFAREGLQADLTLIDPSRRLAVRRNAHLSKCGWTPFEGRKLPAAVAATWVNGELVWRDGLLTGRVPGQRLAFER